MRTFPWLNGKPESVEFQSGHEVRPTVKLTRHPKICDPVSKEEFQGDYEGLMDQIYQQNFKVNKDTKSLKGRIPNCAIINAMNCEMRYPKFYKETTWSKGNSNSLLVYNVLLIVYILIQSS